MTRRRFYPKGKDGDLPNWKGADEPLVVWTMRLFEHDYEPDFSKWPRRKKQKKQKAPSRRDKLKSAIIQAKGSDNLSPLKALHPEFAEFINLPKGGREKKTLFQKYGEAVVVQIAANLVHQIKAQWRKHYGREKRSRLKGQSTAVDVAVRYLNSHRARLTAKEVEDELSGRRRARTTPKSR